MPLFAALLAVSMLSQSTAQKPISKFSAERAWGDLKAQCAFGPRVPGTKAQIDCRDYIYKIAKENCDEASLSELSHTWSVNHKTIKMWNIIAYQNWKNAKIHVVLTTHWDSRPFADQDPDKANYNTPILGADDGASGTAVLLELMRAFKDAGPNVGIIYAITDGEDLGPGIEEMLLGESHFMKNLPNPKPDYGILLDMIGNKGVRVPMEEYSYMKVPKLCKALYKHAGEVGLSSTFPMEVGPEVEDDHWPMIAAGIPTIDLIDFKYEYWHTVQDTVDKCSADSLGKVGKLLETWLRKDPAFSMK